MASWRRALESNPGWTPASTAEDRPLEKLAKLKELDRAAYEKQMQVPFVESNFTGNSNGDEAQAAPKYISLKWRKGNLRSDSAYQIDNAVVTRQVKALKKDVTLLVVDRWDNNKLMEKLKDKGYHKIVKVDANDVRFAAPYFQGLQPTLVCFAKGTRTNAIAQKWDFTIGNVTPENVEASITQKLTELVKRDVGEVTPSPRSR